MLGIRSLGIRAATAVPDFYLNLSNAVGATIGRARANGTIANQVGTISLYVEESAASGVAPFAVFFDASATTSTQTSRPLHDVAFRSDFGDSGAGTWTYGAGANTSRNAASGFVSAHVYETADTYTFTQHAEDGASTSSTTKTITVTAADTEWAGGKTFCLSTGAAPVAGVGGAPAGSTGIGSVTNLATTIASNIGTGNVRFLLKSGDSFSLSSSIVIDKGGPSMIGAFGAGAKPVITATTSATVFRLSGSSTPTQVTDWRFVGLDIDGGLLAPAFTAEGHCSQILILDCDCTDVSRGLLLSASTLEFHNNPTFEHAMWDKFFWVNSTINNLVAGLGPNGFFVSCERIAVMGSQIDTNGGGEHGIRMQLVNRGVITHNTITGIIAGKHHITLRGVDFDGNLTTPAGTYSEKVMVTDNKLTGGANAEIMTIAPQYDTANERGRNFIVERNWFDGSSASQYMIKSAQQDVTIRNNVAYYPNNNGSIFVNAKDEDTSLAFVPTRVNVYNNSIYHASNHATNSVIGFSALGDHSDLTGSTFEVKNNILYTPNGVVSVDVASNAGWPISLATITESNNTGNVGAFATSPAFATNPPTALAHFTPGGASYAAAAGTAVKNWRDMYGTATDATPDLGAVRIA